MLWAIPSKGENLMLHLKKEKSQGVPGNNSSFKNVMLYKIDKI
jgi:hypothetical protein